jgi:glycosyltransferase involved in cell wall biosynthesis
MSRKPRIVIAGQLPPPYGGQNLNLKRLIESLSNSDSYQVEHWNFEFSKDLNQYRKASLSKLRELVRVLQRLAVLRGRGRIDLQIYPSGGPHRAPVIRDILLMPFALLASRRVVVYFQAAGAVRAAGTLPGFLWKVFSFIHRRCWGAVVLTEFGKEDPQSLGMRRIFLIPNGVEDCNPPPCRNRANGHCTLLHVGHLCPDKGTPILLEALARLTPRRDVRLRLVGECMAPYSADLLARDIDRLGLQDVVSWPGLLTGEELQEEFCRASLLVFPSVAPYESFGLAMVEAMMWGLPLVVSNWRANAEVAGQGCGGIIYQPGSDHAASLSAALTEAIVRKSEWPDWGRKNRERYETLFRVERFMSDFESLFATAVAGNRTS